MNLKSLYKYGQKTLMY